MKCCKVSFVFLLFLLTLCYSQSPVFNWVQTPVSAEIIGMGGSGSGFHSDDPLSVNYNPANGLRAYEGISTNYARYCDKSFPIFSSLNVNYDYQHFGLNLIPAKFPFKLVIGHQNFDYHYSDVDILYNNDGDSREVKSIITQKLMAYNLGFGYKNDESNIPLNISAGFSVKNAKLTWKYDGKNLLNEESTMYDFGMISEFPFSFEGIKKLPDCKLTLAPSFGISMQNYGDLYDPYYDGDTITYGTVIDKLALPRLFKLGFSLHGKIVHKSGINVLDILLSREISDLLVNDDGDAYQDIFDDIKLVDNFVLNNSEDVNIYSGFQVSVFDFLSLRYGFDKLSNENTSGIGVKSDGIFYSLKYCTGSEIFSILPNYMTISYDYATVSQGFFLIYYADEDWRSYNSYSLKLKNLESLFARKYKRIKIDKGEGQFSILAGFNYSHFQDKIFTQLYDKKFEAGINFGLEKEVGPVNINFSYKNKSALYKEELDETDKEEGETASKVEMDLDYLSLATLVPLSLNENVTFLPGFEIAHAFSDDFDPLIGDNLKCLTNYNILLCFDWKVWNNNELRLEYSHGLNQIYNSNLFEIYNRSVSLYFKCNVK